MIRNITFLKTTQFVAFIFPAFLMGFSLNPSEGRAAEPILLHKENLVYEGVFRLPTGTIGDSSFGYGGSALAYHASNNSLFLVGHDHHQMVAEISIPTPIISTEEQNLHTATVLQSFTDASEGKMYTIDDTVNGIKVGGLLSSNNKLYGSAFAYYDADGSQTFSHFSSSFNLSLTGDVTGMHQIAAPKAGFVSGYMTPIPDQWQTSLGGPAITGNCCIPIISRTSYGPAAFVFNPSDIGNKSPVPATSLVYYPSSNPLGAWGESLSPSNPYFNGTTQIKGVVFPKESRSLLFIGTQGLGEYCYGSGGTTGDCYDPIKTQKGNHAYPYTNQVWAYDVLDLIKVKNGEKLPWELEPYHVWQFTLPFQIEGDKVVYGAAYDPTRQRIFMSHYRGGKPLIHVFKLNISEDFDNDTSPPSSPSSLQIVSNLGG